MSKNRMSTCKSCGKEISNVGKVRCPNCGRVKKKPIYRRVWFITLSVFIFIAAMGFIFGDDPISPDNSQNVVSKSPSNTKPVSTTPEKAKPMVVTADEMFDALNENALNASNAYKGKYVQVTGKLDSIDAQGKYILLSSSVDEWTFKYVYCYIKKEHHDDVAKMALGQEVTLTGDIFSVGDVFGYYLNVESFD